MPPAQHGIDHLRGPIALFIPNLMGGGAERITINLARSFADRGLEVDLVLADHSGELKDHVAPSVRVVDLAQTRTVTALPHLARYLRRRRPVALLSALGHANLAALWAAKLASFRKPVVVVEHAQLQIGHSLSKSAWFARAVGLTYGQAHGVVAVSHGTKRSLLEYAGLRDDQVVVIYNPVLANDFHSAHAFSITRPEPLGRPGTKVLLGIGRLSAEKNFSLLIRAFKSVREREPSRLVILGEGAERESLQELVSDLELTGDVLMPGFVQDPNAYLEHSDVFVMSSNYEALPTAMIEALSIGIPIVSTDCPTGPREVLKGGEYGDLIPLGDVSALADAMLKALRKGRRAPPVDWLTQFTEAVATDAYLTVLGLRGHRS